MQSKPCMTVSSLQTGICSWGSVGRTLRVLQTICSLVRTMLFPLLCPTGTAAGDSVGGDTAPLSESDVL